ncbi:MAG: hypothetical protein ACOCWS_00180 [Alkalispirochaetaceae bacterium]
MVRQTAQAPPRRRLRLLLSGLLTLLLLSCEIVQTTPVEAYLSYTLGELDVDGRIPDPLKEVEVRVLTEDGVGYLALFARAQRRADNDELLLIDDRLSLRLERNDEFPVRLPLGGLVTESGELILGNLLYNPDTASITNTTAPDATYFTGTQIGGNYYVVQSGGVENSIQIEEFNNSVISLTTNDVTLASGTVFQTGEVFVHDYIDEEGARYIVVITGNFEAGRYVTEIPVSELPTLSGPLFNDTDPGASAFPTVRISGGRAETAIKTWEGIISWDEETSRFTRFDSATGDKLDHFDPGRFQDQEFLERYRPAFFVTGRSYLLLDRERRRIYEVAPWW